MDDWRRVTGTEFLQALWTILALASGAAIQLLQPVVGGLLRPAVFLALSGAWIAGLIVIALYHRRHWGRMVAESSFQPNTGTTLADLETIKNGRSVTVETEIPDVVSQAHMTVQTAVEGVSASFMIQFRYVGSGGTGDGLQTGTDALDEGFVIRGSQENISQVLSPDIQALLLDIETVGTITITGSKVAYEVPFTRLQPEELETIASVTIALAERVEELGG